MREAGLIRSMRFVFILPVFVCYALTVALVIVLTSAMGGRTASSSVMVSLLYTVALALSVCAAAAVPSLSLAVFLFRIRNVRPIRVLFALLEMASNIPPVVSAYLLMYALYQIGWGPSYKAVALSLFIACVPKLSVRLLDALRSVPPQYYLAGAALGDRAATALGRVILREARWDMLSCVVMTALFVVNEMALVQIALGYTLGAGLLPSELLPPTLALLAQRSVWVGDLHTAALAAIALLALDISLCYLARVLKRKY